MQEDGLHEAKGAVVKHIKTIGDAPKIEQDTAS
jgi:hypothetical protein